MICRRCYHFVVLRRVGSGDPLGICRECLRALRQPGYMEVLGISRRFRTYHQFRRWCERARRRRGAQ